jgi:type IV secretory pathway TraG/TraD family ATPase VirD4
VRRMSWSEVGTSAERISQRLARLWWTLPAERQEWLLSRRRRILWLCGVVIALVAPWLLIGFALLAYACQEPPRRATSPVALLAGVAIPAIWISDGLADAGLGDAAGGTVTLCALMAAAAVGAVAQLVHRRAGASQLHPLIWWTNRGLDPAAYGIPRHRVLLGSSGRAWMVAPPQVGALVIGPPRSGKTSGVVIPNVLAWTGPCVVTSTRRDVLDACAHLRARRGTVWCFDPIGAAASTMPPDVHRLDWSPVGGARTMDGALARARALLSGSVEGTEGRDHWRARGTQLLGALLHAAALAGAPMSRVVEWVHGGRLDTASRILEEHADRQALAVVHGVAQTPDRERGSIWSAVAGGLAAFDDSTVLASADRASACAFSAAALLDNADTVFVVAPSDENVPLAPLVVGLVEEIRGEALRRSTATGTLALPLLLALDEVATICPLPSLPQIAAEGGGRNVLLLAVLQDLSQAAARWGREVADGLMTLAGAKLVLPGLADADTLQRIETLAGKHWVEHTSTQDTTSGGFLGEVSWGTYRSLTEEPRIPAGAVRQLAPGSALCITGASLARTIRLVRPTDVPFRHWLMRDDAA